MTNRLFAVTFDCADAAVVGGFWAQALGQELDPGAGREFASIGLHDSGRTEPRAATWGSAGVSASSSTGYTHASVPANTAAHWSRGRVRKTCAIAPSLA